MIYVWQFWYLLCFDLGISVIYGFNNGFSSQPNLKPIFLPFCHHVETFTGKVFWFVLKFYFLNMI